MILGPGIGKGRVSEKSSIPHTFQKRNHSIGFMLVRPERSDQFRLQQTLSAISSDGTVFRSSYLTVMTQHRSEIGEAAIGHVGKYYRLVPESKRPKKPSISRIKFQVIVSLVKCWITPCPANVTEPNVKERKILARLGLTGILMECY